MNELMSSTGFWLVAMILSIINFVVILVFAVRQWLRWTFFNLEGAGRRVFVGMHGWSGEAVVYPEPEEQERTSFFMSPFVRPYAIVDTDRDEVRILITFAPEGAPSSTKDKDEPIATVRISWAVSSWVPVVDVSGDPGDHGGLPANLKTPIGDIKKESRDRFNDRRVADLMPDGQELTHCISGAAALAFMSGYKKGEHMARMFEFVIQHARDLLASLSVQDFMRVRDLVNSGDGEESGDSSRRSLHYEPRIRGRSYKLDDPCFQADEASYEYANMSELQQAISRLLTRVCQLAMEPYGVFIGDITVVRVQLPARLVDASRDREAQEEKKKAVEIFAKTMGEEVPRVTRTGVNEDLAALLLANVAGQEGAGPLAAVWTVIKQRLGG